MAITLAKPTIVLMDAAIDQLAALPAGWDGRDAKRLDHRCLSAARTWLRQLPDNLMSTLPAVVPLAAGTLQFEWHIGNRILELEFESPELIHSLRWDPANGIEDEGQYPAHESDRSHALIDWALHG